MKLTGRTATKSKSRGTHKLSFNKRNKLVKELWKVEEEELNLLNKEDRDE